MSTSDSAKLDAQLLVAYVIDKSVTHLHTWPEQQLTEQQIAHFLKLLSRREQGEPIAYLIGQREFWSLALACSPATLIPRPDTEVLVEAVLERCDASAKNCLDLGTGTGAIALALAVERPLWQIDAVDVNADAVALAQFNAKQHQLAVNIKQSSWFSAIPEQQHYQVIVSNPPYIDAQDEHLSQGDVRFEPRTALVADDQGLADIKSIATQAKKYLTIGGLLAVEHGFTQGTQVRSLFDRLGYRDVETIDDYAGNERITLGYLTQ